MKCTLNLHCGSASLNYSSLQFLYFFFFSLVYFLIVAVFDWLLGSLVDFISISRNSLAFTWSYRRSLCFIRTMNLMWWLFLLDTHTHSIFVNESVDYSDNFVKWIYLNFMHKVAHIQIFWFFCFSAVHFKRIFNQCQWTPLDTHTEKTTSNSYIRKQGQVRRGKMLMFTVFTCFDDNKKK